MFRGEILGNNFRGNYKVSTYNTYPKFHLKRCETINDFIEKGNIHQFYIWSNDKYTDVLDLDTGNLHKDISLNLCYNCKQMLVDAENTTLEFYESLKKEGVFQEERVKKDLNGYD